MSPEEVLSVFRRDAPYLFLGAAFAAVGIVLGGFAVLRRKRDSLLIYFALFATLYGLRLWIWLPMVAMTVQGSTFYPRLRGAVNYVMLIPVFLFFISLGLPKRFERTVGYAMAGFGCALAATTLLFGDSLLRERFHSIAVISASVFFLIRFKVRGSAKIKGPETADFAVIRWGLLIFVAFVVLQNTAVFFPTSLPLLEPFGFAAFLGTLGYVAARSTLRRDQQLKEIQKELEVARRIQLSILPGEFPVSVNFQVAARYVPMTSVAGDYYDYIIADEHQVGLLIADVSGHGVPAALIASMVKLAAASQRAVAADPSRFLSGMNSALLGNTQEQFVTAAFVHLNAESGELRYSAAGHPPLLLLRNGGVTPIQENGLMLAAFGSASYSTAVHRMEAGDRIVMYTDGILEAANAAGDFFGHDALCDLLTGTRQLSPAMAADAVISSVRQWSEKQDDDLTILVCDYTPRIAELLL
ncbi:MAG TPA: PP2C family protein-serine/threonine phosphatase [Terriglobales bacterium]|nr:PP2C family protein-serine/threonine phosphatase [Terriglobales bacterium]